jgi:3-hydroxyisobutyrate dehydrogenase-like beta-hydroxyacid dehydrogenase
LVAEESIQNIGVIGLGQMGAAVASNILKSGFNVIVYNRTESKARSLVEAVVINKNYIVNITKA